MEKRKKRVIEAMMGLKKNHRLSTQVYNELDSMAKEINNHFKTTRKKIEKAQADEITP
ncbi:MAG: hypothetical protein ACI9IP_002475 [Arcticibacterium sp.]|jgi:hypothetical protein